MHKSRDLCVNLYKIGCISAKQLSELIALRSICTIFAQNNGKNMIEGHIINEAESEKAVLVGLITPTQNEAKANEYLDVLSANDFHGVVRLRQTADESTEIKLFSSNKTEITKPSGSQKTEMYISVLFAISDFTKEKRDEDYPLIFDAATSSFGDSKEEEFYNVIDGLDKQCIIVTKDFMTKGVVRSKDIEKLSCPVYRIKKADGFDKNNMATIRTTVTKLKD